MNEVLCIAGKGDVACRALQYVIEDMKISREHIVVIPNQSDDGVPTWQPSLRLLAMRKQITVCTLEEVYGEENLVFVSLEFDRIVRTKKFRSKRLYNIHFSLLPKYRGVGMAMLPLLHGDEKSGVTLHYIDDGIDTGDIIAQQEFEICDSWDCRALYMKFNDESFALFKKWIPIILNESEIPSERQSSCRASYYSRHDIRYDVEDFDKYFLKTAWEATSSLRSATFWEYQLPRVAGRRVMSSRILEQRSIRPPGSIEPISEYTCIVSTVDYDVELRFCAYDDLYEWAAKHRKGISKECWNHITDVDKLDCHGWSAIMIAAYNNNFQCLIECIKHGANVNGPNFKGTTPLMFAKDGAIISGDCACLNALLELGANIEARDYKGLSIMNYLYADKRENAEAVRVIIENSRKAEKIK